MTPTIDFIKDRAVKTISAANKVAATWTWQEMTIVAMQAALTAIVGDEDADPPIIGQEQIVGEANQTMLAARSAWDTGLDRLHGWTAQGLAMAKNKYRNDPAKLSQLDGLTASADGRQGVLDEALAWQTAWAKLDPAWAPMPANTLTAFGNLRKQCVEILQPAYAATRSDWRTATGKLTQLGRTMEDINEAWYADALRAFPEGTPEGDMIRGTIPTTYNPPPDDPPPPPAPPKPPTP
jgi:hypothetical protein